MGAMRGAAEDWSSAIKAAFARLIRDGAFSIGALLSLALAVACFFHQPTDPSLNVAALGAPLNPLGVPGSYAADFFMQLLGWASVPSFLCLAWFLVDRLFSEPTPNSPVRFACGFLSLVLFASILSALPIPQTWKLVVGLGGMVGDGLHAVLAAPFAMSNIPGASFFGGLIALPIGFVLFAIATNIRPRDLGAAIGHARVWVKQAQHLSSGKARSTAPRAVVKPSVKAVEPVSTAHADTEIDDDFQVPDIAISGLKARRESVRAQRELQPELPIGQGSSFELPRLDLLQKPKPRATTHDEAALKQNARLLMTVLSDFGVKGEIVQIRPGPVVTLYEIEPAPGVKTARVIGLSDDIARSMSAIACRVAVVPGRNAIGIELPNARRETVYLRDLLSAPEYETSKSELPLALGETIGGIPYVADLARMPHLLIAGTTGSGKSVGINAMILSLLYRLPPSQCRMIMIDPKMLELSVYQGIPHLLAPVVTDPKKAVAALKWTVREMEGRYTRMSKLGVRNLAGFNQRVAEAKQRGETLSRTVQTGWDKDTGGPIYETETIELEALPFIVVVIDEMADLMLVAGKDIEGAVQRLAQMARAAGIHLVMATQRPSVDVITGTIKANFPTRISYQVTSKIDSRTILGEQGAEQLLGQGDLLFMAGGGRIQRVHGPFVTDEEVEKIVAYLRSQGTPDYRDEITDDPDDDSGDGDMNNTFGEGSGDALYDKAIAIVAHDRKASTSYIQRRLSLGYNRAASLIERMERDGIVSPANHAGKREILLPDHS